MRERGTRQLGRGSDLLCRSSPVAVDAVATQLRAVGIDVLRSRCGTCCSLLLQYLIQSCALLGEETAHFSNESCETFSVAGCTGNEGRSAECVRMHSIEPHRPQMGISTIPYCSDSSFLRRPDFQSTITPGCPQASHNAGNYFRLPPVIVGCAVLRVRSLPRVVVATPPCFSGRVQTAN